MANLFVYNPLTNIVKGSIKHVSTQGFKPTDYPLTVSSQGFLSPEYEVYNLNINGTAYTEYETSSTNSYDYIGAGSVFFEGNVSTALTNNTNSVYNYISTDGLSTGGLASFTVRLGANTTYIYPADTGEGTLEVSGISHVGGSYNIYSDGGTVVAGSADTRLKPGHGGRGVIPWKPIRLMGRAKITPHHYNWYASLLKKFSKKFRGYADVEFEKRQKFKLFPELDKLPVIKSEKPKASLFKAIQNYLDNKKAQKNLYSYEAKVVSKNFVGEANNEFVAVDKQINILDEEFLTVYMLQEDNVTYIINQDKLINRQRKEDDLLLEMLID